MNYCGIVCEYNPFHTGHLYQLTSLQAMTHIDAVVGVMSGNFVQRADPAIINKYLRSEIALKSGMHAVIQIPTAYTVSGGEKFAESALAILNLVQGMKYLAFGCETNDFILLEKLAAIRANECDLFKESFSLATKGGIPYPRALLEATKSVAIEKGYDVDKCIEMLSKPNNILAIEYLKAIYQNNYPIQPIFIHRADNYNSTSLGSKYSSATALRAALKENICCQSYLPYDGKIIEENMVDYKLFDELLLFALRMAGIKDNTLLKSLADCGEGIENKLWENALKYTNITDVLNNTKSKRYTYARLKRLAIQSLFGITKDIVNNSASCYGKLLGIRKEIKKSLSDFSQLIITYKDATKITDKSIKKLIQIDELADNTYSQLTSTKAATFFSSKLLEI